MAGALPIDEAAIEAVAAAEQRELERRERLYRDGRPAPRLRDRSILLVDDGLATGASMRAAVAAARGQGPRRVVVAVPVAPPRRAMRCGGRRTTWSAAAALVAAARRPRLIHAVVSRGGRPDLAGESLPRVESPTLLIVGGADEAVIGLNEQASERLNVTHRLEIVPGATHLFEEPGALERVGELAAGWFARYLAPAATRV